MSTSRLTVFFALFLYVGYQVGFKISFWLYPTILIFVLPPLSVGLGFVFFTLPLAVVHATIIEWFVKKSSLTSRWTSVAGAFVISTLIVVPIIIGLSWLSLASLDASYPNISEIVFSDDNPHRLHEAKMNCIVRHGITFLLAAWGTTTFFLIQTIAWPGTKNQTRSSQSVGESLTASSNYEVV